MSVSQRALFAVLVALLALSGCSGADTQYAYPPDKATSTEVKIRFLAQAAFPFSVGIRRKIKEVMVPE